MTDEAITAAAEADPDNPPLTDEELARGLFAQALGIPVATLRDWEQGRIAPDPALRALMKLVLDDPGRAVRVSAA
ncbi:MAG: transcriptional regulator [Methylobacterium frigidaeris]